jgi:hypothetical protein
MAVLCPPVDLDKTKVFIKRKILEHRLVGVQSEAAEATSSGLRFGELHESTSEARSLSMWMHSDVLKK